MLWRQLGFLRLSVFTLRISGTAGNDAAALLALHHPGRWQPANLHSTQYTRRTKGEKSTHAGIFFSYTGLYVWTLSLSSGRTQENQSAASDYSGGASFPIGRRIRP